MLSRSKPSGDDPASSFASTRIVKLFASIAAQGPGCGAVGLAGGENARMNAALRCA